MPTATAFGRGIAYNEEFSSIKSHDPLIMWSCELTLHIKNAISPLALDQWPPKMAKWWLTVSGFHS